MENRSFAGCRCAAAALGLGLLLLTQPAQAGMATLTVGTDADWAALPDSLRIHNFPLLVRLDSSTFDFSQVESDGSDLRFTAADGKPLYHQIDAWDAAAKRAAVWVRLDSLRGDAIRTIRMLWGNSAGNTPSNGSKVFDTADGFLGVWHLQEKADSAAGRFLDATAFGRHGTGFGLGAAATVPGLIGNTQTFDPANSTYISLGDVGAQRESTFTISMWVKGPGNQNDVRFFSETGAAADPIAGLGTGAGDGASKLDYYARNDAAVQLAGHVRSEATVFDGAWHYVALVQDRGAYTLFVDGKADARGSFKFPTLFSSTRTTLGAVLRSSLTGHFTGNIDEVRISRVIRSPDYLRALYENQKAGQDMVGPPVPDGCRERFGTDKDTVRVAEASSASVAGMAACALRWGWWKVVGDSAMAPLASQGAALEVPGDRVWGDSTYRLRFRALYGDGWRSKDVIVRIVENVPDPEFTLTVPPTWNGLDSLDLQPVILNLDALNAGPAPIIHYSWSRTGVDVAARENPRSLTLLQSFGSGPLTIGLCLDNGGAKKCKSATVDVREPSALGASLTKNAAVEFTDGFIHWNAPTRVRILSLDGKVLLDRTGRPGQNSEIPSAVRRALARRENKIRITPRP